MGGIMSTAATSTVTTFAGCLEQLNLLTNGIDMVPSRLSEETIYVASAEEQDGLPTIIDLRGERTEVAEMFDRAFPVERVSDGRGDEVVENSKLSSFVGRVKALDAVLDRDVETVLLGLMNRTPNTFKGESDGERWAAFRDFNKFINTIGRERVRKVMKADTTLRVMADEAFKTAELADKENRPEAVADAFFVSGRLYAALKDIGMSHTDAGLAFETAAPLFESAKRFVAVAICYELVAEMRELRDMNSNEARQKAAEAWLKAVGRGKELKVDDPSLSMAIFRGMWNAHRVNDVPTMISFLELSAEQFVKADRYANAADDLVRIMNLKLPTLKDGDRDDWKIVEGYLDTLRDYVREMEPPSDLMQGLIDLSNDAHENRVRA
jgi:hypothetical protein